MSKIIIDKLKAIEQIGLEDAKENCSMPSPEPSTNTKDATSAYTSIGDLSEETVRTLASSNEDLDYMSKIWASKLKKLNKEQRFYAEKAVHDVLFEAQLGNLNKASVKINQYTRSPATSPEVMSENCDSSPMLSTGGNERQTSEVTVESFHNDQRTSSESQVDNTVYSKSDLTPAKPGIEKIVAMVNSTNTRNDNLKSESNEASLSNLSQDDDNLSEDVSVSMINPQNMLTQLCSSADTVISCTNKDHSLTSNEDYVATNDDLSIIANEDLVTTNDEPSVTRNDDSAVISNEDHSVTTNDGKEN